MNVQEGQRAQCLALSDCTGRIEGPVLGLVNAQEEQRAQCWVSSDYMARAEGAVLAIQ